MGRALAAVAAALVVVSAGEQPGHPRSAAKAYLVENGATGEVLAGSRANARVPIASITKLMTVLVALEHAQLDDVVVAPASARAPSASRRSTSVRASASPCDDLVEAALVQSANDAAWALAAHVGKGDVEQRSCG